MISIKEMKKSEGNKAKIYFVDGDALETYIELYEEGQDDGEENFLLVKDNLLINQSEIEKIEVLG
ncbi:hypothetical protein PEPTYR26121_01503 [Peptoniphilus tyrrelliae]|nr:hypothetical protein PEPTYR26121_01503 [Peptoniphilus tyrrelliae]